MSVFFHIFLRIRVTNSGINTGEICFSDNINIVNVSVYVSMLCIYINLSETFRFTAIYNGHISV